LTVLDAAIIALYFAAVLGLGVVFRRRASRNLDAYFLGGRRLHWLTLAMSGSVSNFDITGTMWIVSILFVLGMKSMWHHWMWGFLMGAFFLAYMGKWVRRSNVMTAAEWMETRFGTGTAGKTARTAYALMAVLTLAGFIGYAFQGIGKFAATYIPTEILARLVPSGWSAGLLTEHKAAFLAVVIIGVTTVYVVMGGLFSVVATDVLQTVVLTASSILIAVIAWSRTGPETMARLPGDFASLKVPWRIPEFQGTPNAAFEFFGALVVIWVIKGLLMNAGGPAQMYDFQRFLAARSDRDAAKVGAAWSLFLVVRWALVMGIVVLALTGTREFSDPEKVMPVILGDVLPAGVRGVVIAGLLAAFMSTFSSTVNSGASFLVRDLWLPFVRPGAGEREAVRWSYGATVFIVVLGVAIGLQTSSIAEIWNWLMVSLGAGVIIPNVLRWYWWRMNGWGYALGMLGGIALSIVTLFFKDMPVFVSFPLIVSVSFLASVVGSLATRPTEPEVLARFFRSVRPFGLWKPIREKSGLSKEGRTRPSEKPSLAILNVVLGMTAIFAFYLAPMYLVGHWTGRALLWLGIGTAAVLVLWRTWYRNLPGDDGLSV